MNIPFGLLIACQRSGTGALGSVLDKHPQLHYLGEIFHPANIGQEKNYFSHLLHKARDDESVFLPDRNGENLKTFLDSITDSGIIPIIDTKYNSLHHLNGGWHPPLKPPWFLQHARALGVPIIHLTRRNFVEVFVSGRLAEANQVWHARKAEEAKIRSAAIDPQALLRFIRHAQEEQSLIERWLAGHSPLVVLDYAEMFDSEGALARDWAKKIAAAFSVDAFTERASHFIKQAPASLRESIENYKEVKRALSGLEHEWMLGEETTQHSIRAMEQLAERNRKALNQVSVFRSKQAAENFGTIDQTFHWHKNHFPYFGHVEVNVGKHSLVMFSGNDDLVAMTYFWYGPSSFERRSVSLWTELCREAEIVFDVGAHSALYSLLAATINPKCRIAAFEPSRRTHGRILLNSYLNGFENRIVANCLAVSDKVGQLNLLQFRGENILGVGASILEKDIPFTDDSEIVETVTLDDFCLDQNLWPDLMKIDVEGAEVLALKGAKRFLFNKRPHMLIKVMPKTALDVYRILTEYGYTLSTIDETREELLHFDGKAPHVLNIYAHAEKIS